MSLELISSIVIGLGTVLLLWQQNRILQQQNEIFAKQEGIEMAGGAAGSGLRKYWPMPAMGTLMSLAWIGVGFDYYYVRRPFDPGKAWDDSMPLKPIYQKYFTNETVPLDAYNYVRPTFDNVTFEYEGTGASAIDHGTFVTHEGQVKVRLVSKNKIVTQTMKRHQLHA